MNIFDKNEVVITRICNAEKIRQPYGFDYYVGEYRGHSPKYPNGFFTLAFVIDGECDYTFDVKNLRAKSGDIVFLDNYTPFHQVTASDFYIYVINFAAESGFIQQPCLIRPSSWDKYLSMFKEASVAFEQRKPGYILLTKSILYKILATLKADNMTVTYRLSKNEKISFAVDYISNNLKDYQLSVEKIANEMNISTAYLRKIFVEAIGMSPLKYIKTMRINRSSDILLSARDVSVADVARECGFQDVSYFCKEFKKIMGTSPLTFKKKHHITTAPIRQHRH